MVIPVRIRAADLFDKGVLCIGCILPYNASHISFYCLVYQYFMLIQVKHIYSVVCYPFFVVLYVIIRIVSILFVNGIPANVGMLFFFEIQAESYGEF